MRSITGQDTLQRAAPVAEDAQPAGTRRARTRTPQVTAAVALVLLCAAASALFALYLTPYGIDDSWITYLYAENLADGHGFVFNHGERVLGTSAPLYTLILAGAHLAGAWVPATSTLLGLIGMLGALVATFLLVRLAAGELTAIVASAALVLMQDFHRVASYGMETPLYVALVLGAFLAYAKGRTLLAAAAAALCLVMRLDGGAVGATLLVTELLRTRRLPWRAAAVYLLLAAPWFVFSQAYFGSVLPNTLAAKREHTSAAFQPWLPRWLASEPMTALAAFGWILLLRSAATRAVMLPCAIWAAVYAGAFTFGGVDFYDWYLTPLCPVLAMGLGACVTTMAAAVGPAPLARWAVLLGVPLLVLSTDLHRAVRRLRGDEGMRGLESVRFEAAQWMRDNLPHGEMISTGGIGHVGYLTRRYVLDVMGLVSPEVLEDDGMDDPRLTDQRYGRLLARAIRRWRPRFVFDGFQSLRGDQVPFFMEGSYRVARTWEGENPLWPRFVLMERIAAGESAR